MPSLSMHTKHEWFVGVMTNRTAFLSEQRGTASAAHQGADGGPIPAPSEIVEVTDARHDLGSKTLDVPVLAVDAALRLLP